MSETRKIVVIGETGTGKSSLCNVIAGKPVTSDFFPVGHKLDSKTWQTTVNPAKWKGDGFDIDIIDTPGLDDPNGPQKDDENIAEMIKKLKELDHVHLFFVIFNGEVPRLSRTLMELLKIFRDMFGPHFLMNTVFGFSRWSFDKRAIKTRQQQQKTEASLTEDLNNKLRENGFQLRKDVPAVFIDSMYDDECSKEKEEFVQNMKRLSVHAQTMDPFPCSQFQEGVQRDITNAKKAEEEAKHAKEKAEEELKVAEEKAKRLKEKAEEEKRKADKAEEKARNDAAKARADKKRDDEIAKLNMEKLQAEMMQMNNQRLMEVDRHKRELDDNYGVCFQLTVENCTTKRLDPQGNTVESGLVSRAQVAVTPGMTEGMAGRKTAGAACGCVGTVSWKIGDTNRKLVVMYSVPFNHDYYSNVCAAGIFALNATIDFDMMYYKSENGFKRKDFWKDLTALTYDKDSMFVVTASMGSNHRPHIKVQLKAKSL